MLEQLLNNQFATGGLLLGGLAAVFAWARRLPGQLFDFTRRRVIYSLDFNNYESLYEWFSDWLSDQPYSKKCKQFSVSVKPIKDNDIVRNDSHTDMRIKKIPAPGTHYFWYKKRFVIFSRNKLEKDNGGIINNINLTFFTTRRDIIESFLQEISDVGHKEISGKIRVFTRHYEDWKRNNSIVTRPLESVILAQGVMDDIVSDISKFLTNSEQYHKLGMIHKRGYLFHGPPGSGKTSLILALASYFKWKLCIINLKDTGLTDGVLTDLISNVPDKGVILLEDVDCVIGTREEDKNKTITGVSLGGLLNVLDGVGSSEGQIVLATTNYPEKLDPAIIRSGRIDYKIFIGHPDRDQIQRIAQRFIPTFNNEEVINMLLEKKLSMADIQSIFMNKSKVDIVDIEEFLKERI